MVARAALSPRLAAIAELVSDGARVLDVGADHGRLALSLLATGRARRAVATDRSAAALAGASRRARGSAVRVAVADGLDAFAPDAFDTIVIAGMGGSRIAGILSRARRRIPADTRLLLQPNDHVPLLRRALVTGSIAIVDERLVEESGRSYVVLVGEPRTEALVTAAAATWREADWLLGPFVRRRPDPAVDRYLARERDRLSGALGSIDAAGKGAESRARRRALARALAVVSAEIACRSRVAVS